MLKWRRRRVPANDGGSILAWWSGDYEIAQDIALTGGPGARWGFEVLYRDKAVDPESTVHPTTLRAAKAVAEAHQRELAQ